MSNIDINDLPLINSKGPTNVGFCKDASNKLMFDNGISQEYVVNPKGYSSYSAMVADTANIKANSVVVAASTAYVWDGTALMNLTGYVVAEMTGNLALASASPANTLYVNNTANTYTVTVSPGAGAFGVLNLSTGSITVQSNPENLITYSNDFTQSVWGSGANTTAAYPTAGQTSPVDGSNTVSTITCNSSSAAYINNTADITTQGATYTLSGWVKGYNNGSQSSIGAYIDVGNYNNNQAQLVNIKLTANWQYFSVTFEPQTASNNTLYWSINQAGAGKTNSNVPNGAAFFVADIQLVKGQNKQYVRNSTGAGGKVSSNSNIVGTNAVLTASPSTVSRLDVTEIANGNFAVAANFAATNNSQLPLENNGFLLIKPGGVRGDSIVLAGCDTQNPYASDYICTGSNDDLIIAAAFNSLNTGVVKLRSGTYGISNPIILNNDSATLMGESRPMWREFAGPYNGAQANSGYEGLPGGAKLKQLATMAQIILVGSTFKNGNRHKGLCFKNLYLYGLNLTGTGIYDANSTDISSIEDCVFHNLLNAINVGWDTPFISGNSIQSCAGYGIYHNFVFGNISKNIIYDCGGSAIILDVNGGVGGGTNVTNNVFGSLGYSGAPGILIKSPGNTVSSNTLNGINNGSIIEITGSYADNNQISANALSLDNPIGNATPTINTTGHGIWIHGGANNNNVVANNINNTTASSSGYAVALGVSGTDTTATGNNIVANNITGGKWNGGAANTIGDFSGGTTNAIGYNVGDNPVALKAPTALSVGATGSTYTNTTKGLQQVMINGGTTVTTTITRNGGTAAALPAGAVTAILSPGDVLTYNYATAPYIKTLQLTTSI